jgi:hypothetical protein
MAFPQPFGYYIGRLRDRTGREIESLSLENLLKLRSGDLSVLSDRAIADLESLSKSDLEPLPRFLDNRIDWQEYQLRKQVR